MKIILTISGLVFAGIVLADDSAKPEPRFVTSFDTEILYVYNDDFEEIGEIKGKAVERDFQEVVVAGVSKKGLPIHAVNDAEGLVQVSLSQYPDTPVWLETMSVKIEPDNRLSCPPMAQTREDVTRHGMTIGFGEHCENADQVAAEAAVLPEN